MLSTIRDVQGHILAVAESRVVNHLGQLDHLGSIVWIEQIEVSDGVNGRAMIAEIILDIANRSPRLQWAYWVRRDKTGTKVHGLYSRARLLALAQRSLQEVR